MHAFSSRLLLALTLTWLLCAGAQAQTAAHRFEKEIAAFEAGDKKTPPPENAILFVGDSTYTKWKTMQQDLPEFTVINRGFGGSTMADLLFYCDRVVLPYVPRLIVVQEGGNDLHGGRTPEQLVADMKSFLHKVRSALPAVPIILCSTTPSPARWGEVETRQKANALVQALARAEKEVAYVNLFDPFLGSDGKPAAELYGEDHLHPSQAGYELRVKILRPLLGKPDRAASR